MEASPKEVDIKALTEELAQVVGVVDIHDIHLWSISVGKPSISLHILSRAPQKTLEQTTLICKKISNIPYNNSSRGLYSKQKT